MSLQNAIAKVEPYRRVVTFDWEPVPDASGYEVELKPNDKDIPETKTYLFKTESALWSGKLFPGLYNLRLRSYDERKVPGDWSPTSDFKVGLDNVILDSPVNNVEIQTKQKDVFETTIKWKKTDGTNYYLFKLTDTQNNLIREEKLTTTQIILSLPVAKKYKYTVQAFYNESIFSDKISESEFTLLGSAYAPPTIINPENEFVRELKWNINTAAQDQQTVYSLYRLSENKKWNPFFETKLNSSITLKEFLPEYPGGIYRLVLKSTGELREDSSSVQTIFAVKNGDRSKTAEYLATIKNSINRSRGWYLMGSWLITMMNYQTNISEINTPLEFSNAFGGTGRIGLGLHEKNKSWGFLGIADLSGIIINNKNRLFSSFEINSVYKYEVNERTQLKTFFGTYFKEFPITYLSEINDSGNINNTSNIATSGLHFSSEYWYSISPKIGLQANIHLYQSLKSHQSITGKDSKYNALQLGMLGSYRYSKEITGLIGYAYKKDQVYYNHPSIEIISQPSIKEFYTNASITGHYLNLYAEWNF